MIGRRARRGAFAAVVVVAIAPASAGAAITYVNQASAATTTATLTITKPTNTTTNDVLVATVSGAGTNVINAPAGWTLLASTVSTGSTMRTLTYVKVATASEGTSYAFTSSAARNMTGGIIALRGVNRDWPVDAVGVASGASGNAVSASVTTSAANHWVITASSVARNSTSTPASGTTERYDRAGTSTSNEAATAAQAAAGATPVRTVVPATATANWVVHTIALRDAATAGLSVDLGATSQTFTSDLDDGDDTEQWTIGATVNDTRVTSSAGWQLQVTSTTLTTGTHSLAPDATQITAVDGAACDAGAPCLLPTNDVALPVAVPAAGTAPTAVKFFNADGGTGEGRIDLTITFAPTVPQNAFAGSYASTVTVSVISGP